MDTYTRDGLTFDVTDAGPADGELVVLLHGFPQDRTAWQDVTPALNAAGLRTIAPDQRGYSPGASPKARSAYAMRELVADVLALADAAGAERFHVVGHDWGGAVAWTLGERVPQRVASLTVLSTPHPRALNWAMLRSDQAKRSWYMAMFQLPTLPEKRLHAMLGGFYRRSGLTDEQAARYEARFPTPASLTAPMNWYRAMPTTVLAKAKKLATRSRSSSAGPSRSSSASPSRSSSASPSRSSSARDERVSRPTSPSTVTVPTTYVWGSKDFALGRAAAERTAELVSGDYRFVEVKAGHWLPEANADLVAEEITRRVRSAP